jgi:hypothetical protein
LAREAAVALIATSREEEQSLGIRLLADLRTVFGETEALFTDAILQALHELEESPWKDLKGKSLDSRGLGLRLRQYGIKSNRFRDGVTNKRGYARADLVDAWERYLPPSPCASGTSGTSGTSEQFQWPDAAGVPDEAQSVPEHTPDASPDAEPKTPTESTSVPDVPDVPDVAGQERRTSDAVNGGDPREDRTCVQCKGEVDGSERLVWFSGQAAVWLHRECKKFWFRTLEDGER